MTDTDYADNQVLLTNVPAQAEYQQYNLEYAAEGIGLYMNANKQISFVLNNKDPSPHKVRNL